MRIGLCGSGFPDVRRALSAALPDAEIVDIPASGRDEQASEVDVLVPLGATVEGGLMDATRPRLIQQFGVGLQGVDLTAAATRGIPVANVPAADTGNAEVAMLHLLAQLRRYRQTGQSVAERRVGQPCGSLVGKTVTVLGVGAVGTALLVRLNAFGAVPLAVGRREFAAYPSLTELLQIGRYFRTADLNNALARSQVLIVCCPLTEQTRGLVGADQLAAMPAGGYLINVGRGPVVDYTALLHALDAGRLAGAGLDVAWEEPVDPEDALLRENVTITPHIGGVTTESYAAIDHVFATNVRKFRAGEPLAHLTS